MGAIAFAAVLIALLVSIEANNIVGAVLFAIAAIGCAIAGV